VLAGMCAAAAVSGGAGGSVSEAARGSRCEIIKITSGAGIQSEAAYFAGAPDKAVIFVPGAVFDKESWSFLAERLQGLNVASLALDGKTPDAVGASIAVLKQKGFKRILLVGGSMGGAAILDALKTDSDESIAGLILLAPAGGRPVTSAQIDKLFIVAKGDGLYAFAKDVYARSSDPKTFAEIEGSAHAQHLFNTAHREELIGLIVDFVMEDK
jgi:pimeloyl-ACP methyl ester carboxylesterase